MGRDGRRIVVAGGAVLVAACLILAFGTEWHLRIRSFLPLYFVMFAVYAFTAWRVVDSPADERLLRPIVIVAIISRLILVPAAPEFSTDIFRYIFEGRMVLAGFNPFTLAPDATELTHMRDIYFESINHKHLSTIYPPFAQGVFALAAWIKPTLWMQKLAFVGFELGTVLFLIRWLRYRKMDANRVILFAWNPLVIIETAHSGHVDAVGICAMVAGLYWIDRGSDQRSRVAGFVALAISALAKLIAIAFVPFLVMRRRNWLLLLLALAVMAVGYFPFASAGRGLISSLLVYSETWVFNGAPYLVLSRLLEDPVVVRRVLAVVTIILVITYAFRIRDIAAYGLATIGTMLLLAPTLYAWYLSWIIPFLCLRPNRSWVLFTGLVFCSYWVWEVVRLGGEWIVPGYIVAIEYTPFYVLFLYDVIRKKLRRV